MARQHQRRYQKSRKSRPSFKGDPLEVTITDIGQRGDGIAKTEQADGKVESYFIRNAMVGDVLRVRPIRQHQSGYDAEIIEIITSSPDRITPDCPSASECGGCQFQYMAKDAYQDWKLNTVQSILGHAGITPQEWRPQFSAEYGNRRRTRLAWRRLKDGVICGFREARSHRIIPPDGCLVLHPELCKAIDVLQNNLLPSCDPSAQGEVEITLCENSQSDHHPDHYWDIALRPQDVFSAQTTTNMVIAASAFPIARLSQIHSSGAVELLFEKTPPHVTWSLDDAHQNAITLIPAAGSFMQADANAERHMQLQIAEELADYQQIADLFCGSGSLSLPLLTRPTPPKKIIGIDSAPMALNALMAAAKSAGHHHRISVENRNLFKNPLSVAELAPFDAAIIDPPRAGAMAQMPAIAASTLKKVMMVSCNPTSFARDAQLLIEGGFHCRWVQVIDQFYLTSHTEIMACFDR